MTSALFFPGFLLALAVVAWNAFPRRIVQDLAKGEITPQQSHRYIVIYRSWSVVFTLTGLTLVILTLTN